MMRSAIICRPPSPLFLLLPPGVQLALVFGEEAVEAGSATAMFLLAEMYEKGEYVGKDLKRARKLYLMPSENGMPEAREEADRL